MNDTLQVPFNSSTPLFEYIVSKIEFLLNKEAAIEEWKGIEASDYEEAKQKKTGRRLLASDKDCRVPKSQKKTTCTRMKNKAYLGKLIVVKKRVSSVGGCCKACQKRRGCTAWTFKPKSTGKLRGCYLRSRGYKRLITKKGYWAGTVGETKENMIPPSPPPSPPPYIPYDPYDPYDPFWNSPPSPPPPSINYEPIGPAPNLPPGKAKYKEVLELNWKFYEAQRSGEEPSWNRIDWRGTSHTGDKIPGGWYDAGDTLKLPFPMAPAVGHIAMGLIEFDDGYRKSGQKKWALRNFRIAVKYLYDSLDKEAGTFVGQLGDPKIDHNYWGRPEEQNLLRPTFVYNKSMPAADLYGGVAGALAAAAVVFDREGESRFSNDLIDAAKELYSWGDGNPGRYSNFYKDQTKIYRSGDSDDSMAWAAGWLYRATRDTTWLDKALDYWSYGSADVYPGWDSLWAGHAVHMVSLADKGITIPGESEYRRYLNNKFYRAWLQPDGFQSIIKTPQGMVYPRWNKWANLQFSTTVAGLAQITAKFTKSKEMKRNLMNFSRSQVDYAIGGNKVRSYLIGYGYNYPKYAHHAPASCPDVPEPCGKDAFRSSAPNPQILYGALVAGPAGERENKDRPDYTYYDKRDDYVTNEVSVGYNAGLATALAGLYEQL